MKSNNHEESEIEKYLRENNIEPGIHFGKIPYDLIASVQGGKRMSFLLSSDVLESMVEKGHVRLSLFRALGHNSIAFL